MTYFSDNLAFMVDNYKATGAKSQATAQTIVFVGSWTCLNLAVKELTVCLLITTIVVFNLFFLTDQITVIGNEMSVYTSRFANVLCQIKQISVIFSHLKLWVAVARHNFKWLKI